MEMGKMVEVTLEIDAELIELDEEKVHSRAGWKTRQ